MYTHTQTNTLPQSKQATRSALQGDDPLEKLEADWCNLDKENVLAHALFATQSLKLSDQCMDMVPKCKWCFVLPETHYNSNVGLNGTLQDFWIGYSKGQLSCDFLKEN